MHILFAEDELAMSEAIVDILTYHNFTVDAVYDGKEALTYAASKDYDGIILDVMMPKLDGISVLSALRSQGNRTPILLLTAKGEVEDRIAGLDAGADDYLAKPFVMAELLARLRAMLRRRESYIPDELSLGNITLDRRRYAVRSAKASFHLGRLEYKLLELFISNPQMVFSIDTLLERVWGCDSNAGADTVWVYISYVRKKLTAMEANIAIHSKRGLGYLMEVTR